MATNLVSYFIDSALFAARNAEYPGDPFTDTGAGTFADPKLGCNNGASNAGGLGINTGDYDPKATDWKPPATAPTVVEVSQVIGGAASGVLLLDPATAGDNELVAFVVATGDVAPGGTVETVAGFPMRNRTGKTVPDTSAVWAVGDQL